MWFTYPLKCTSKIIYLFEVNRKIIYHLLHLSSVCSNNTHHLRYKNTSLLSKIHRLIDISIEVHNALPLVRVHVWCVLVVLVLVTCSGNADTNVVGGHVLHELEWSNCIFQRGITQCVIAEFECTKAVSSSVVWCSHPNIHVTLWQNLAVFILLLKSLWQTFKPIGV